MTLGPAAGYASVRFVERRGNQEPLSDQGSVPFTVSVSRRAKSYGSLQKMILAFLQNIGSSLHSVILSNYAPMTSETFFIAV
ncbi:UNVERIFIED_CONTAM: hypothetical protein FKN15_037461 [Acipenser sinensis]